MKHLDQAIQDFNQDVVERAQRNLGTYRTVIDGRGRRKRRRADSSGNLRKSLTFNSRETNRGKIVSFFAQGTASDYANFVEYGVNGTRRKHGAPFSFKGKNINQEALMQWFKKKPIRMRTFKDGKLGGFAKNTEQARKTAAFLIGRSIAAYGFAPLNYMRDAMTSALKDWKPIFEEALVKDAQERLK